MILKNVVMALVVGIMMGLAGPAAWAQKANFATGELVLGAIDAPIEIIEYASMTCPHCANFHANGFKALKKKYIDTGKVRFVFREFPLDRLAFMAAKVARCAGRERFWSMLDVLFAQQSSWARAENAVVYLRNTAKLAGIGEAAFDACVADKDLETIILINRKKGEDDDKVTSTPTLIINGQKVPGDNSLAALEVIIGPLLEAGAPAKSGTGPRANPRQADQAPQEQDEPLTFWLSIVIGLLALGGVGFVGYRFWKARGGARND